MSIELKHVLTCDGCGAELAYDATRNEPQQALADAVLRFGWTIYGERLHCAFCLPLCSRCGSECANDDFQHCDTCGDRRGQS